MNYELPKAKISLANRRILKIAVMADGIVIADGSPITIELLTTSLKALAEENGVVWYYREASQSKAPSEVMEIVRLIVEHRIPVRLSTRPDYSDSVDKNGKPIGADGKPITK